MLNLRNNIVLTAQIATDFPDDDDDSDESFCARVVDRELALIFTHLADRDAHRAAAVEAALSLAVLARELNLGIEDAASDATWRLCVPADSELLYDHVFRVPSVEDVEDSARRAERNPNFGQWPPRDPIVKSTDGWACSIWPRMTPEQALKHGRGDEPVIDEPQAAAREALADEPRNMVLSAREIMESDEPDPEFVLPGWLQSRKVNLLTGEDGSGKSLLLLMLFVAMVSGKEFFGMKVKRGKVLFFTAEEEARDMKSRLRAVCKHMGVKPAALDDLHIIAMGGAESSMLGGPGKDGKVEASPLWRSVVKYIADLRPVAVGIDPLNEVFDGDELSFACALAIMSRIRSTSVIWVWLLRGECARRPCATRQNTCRVT